jgi:prophage tail gpP-like protein
MGFAESVLNLTFVDYTRDLNRELVAENYKNMTDRAIIKDIVHRYTIGSEITATDANIAELVTFTNINFNYLTVGESLSKICESTGYHWYIDYEKNIHYFPSSENVSDYRVKADSTWFTNLSISKDNSNIRNRVYVKGGVYLSDEVTIYQVADGEQTTFILPEKPSEITVTEGAAVKNCGIKNIDTFTDFDYLMSYQEKYVETDVAPAQGTVMTFAFKFYIPVIVIAEDSDSVEEVGHFEYMIADTKIASKADARSRASAELTDYGNTMIDGTFECWEGDFYAGQYVFVHLPAMGITNEEYIVQKVTATSISGAFFKYKVTIASAKKLGIIKFLKRMLANEKNKIESDSDDVVDGLYSPAGQDIIITDSITSNELYSISSGYVFDTAKFDLSEFIG